MRNLSSSVMSLINLFEQCSVKDNGVSGIFRSPLYLASSFLWISDIMSFLKFKVIPLFSALREIYNEFTDVRNSTNIFLLSKFRD